MSKLGLSQHDLAELLCFVLAADVSESEVRVFLEKHRSALQLAAGISIDKEGWLVGFQLSLADLLIHRFAMYAMIHRFRAQTFLPRVIRTWRRLYEMFL